MKRILVLILLLIASPCWASTVGPLDCSAATVNAAIAAAAAGETITLTCTGTITWDAQINLSGGKTLAGPGLFNAADTTNHGTWPLVIQSTVAGANYIIQVTNANETLNRVTGLKFVDSGTSPHDGIAVFGKGNFRVDNNCLYDVTNQARIIRVDGTTGQLNGSVDHNFIYTSTPPPGDTHKGNISSNSSSKGASATCNGSGAYNRTITWGGSDFVFFEANYLYNGTIESSGGGNRMVVRYNTFYATSGGGDFPAVDGHGTDTNGYHCLGFVAGEVYNNYFTGVASSYAQFVNMRGGKWLTYNNYADTGAGGKLQFDEYRARGNGGGAELLEWQACAGALCCATEYATWITNCNLQYPGAGDYANCHPLPNQVQSTYLWNNKQGAGDMTVSVVATGAVQTYIQAGTDYFLSTYSYTPYTCPHPLVGSGSCNSTSYGLSGYNDSQPYAPWYH